jgi:hypothetical protein
MGSGQDPTVSTGSALSLPLTEDTTFAYGQLALAVVTVRLGLSPAETLSAQRDAALICARHAAIYLAHTVFGFSHVRTASAFGRRRSTTAYACRAVEEARAKDKDLDRFLDDCAQSLRTLPRLEPRAGVDRTFEADETKKPLFVLTRRMRHEQD